MRPVALVAASLSGSSGKEGDREAVERQAFDPLDELVRASSRLLGKSAEEHQAASQTWRSTGAASGHTSASALSRLSDAPPTDLGPPALRPHDHARPHGLAAQLEKVLEGQSRASLWPGLPCLIKANVTARRAKPWLTVSRSALLATRMMPLLALSAGAAQSSEASSQCDVVAELSCGDDVRLLTSGPTLPFTDAKELLATNHEDWARLWAYLGLPAPLPVVDFTADTVVAWISTASECGADPPKIVLCSNGALQLRRRQTHCNAPLVSQPRPRWVWIAAVSRLGLARLTNQANDNNQRQLECRPEIDADELKARWRAQRATQSERSWFEALRWNAAVGAVGGYSSRRRGLYGAELRAGLRDDIGMGGGAGFLGDLVGLDLRARWLQAPSDGGRALFMLGLWPWMMTTHDWVLHRWFSRQPTFMTLVVPEAGLVLDGGVDWYLYWSFPIMLRETTYFYRTSPYVLGEHVAFELVPGLLWRPTPRRRDVVVTLGVSMGLW